ncbi:hypothetical protein TDB9533_01786 [Thalassocella blandensis]|nr:hypothetical protein TDB9533_01786 [Thalassocella blandensis]
MNRSSVYLAVAALTLGTGAQADSYHNDAYDYARVTHVSPVYEQVEHRVPREECWMETVEVNQPRNNHAAGTIVGGVLGGAVGHAVGHGHKNRKVSTALGAIVGMSIGNQVSQRHQDRHASVRYEEFQRCETRYTTEYSERLAGYDVSYQYLGQRYTTRMQHDPGDRIRVAVNVRPVGR